jgi:glycosyltransferase involved in cell wall biosynthesis
MILPKRIAQVVTIHDLVWRYAPHTMKPLSSIADKIMIGKAIRSADRVLVVSENTGRDVSIQYRSAATRVRLVKPGIARLPKPQDLSELRSIGIDRPYVLFVGTLEPRKNLERLLEAYGHLPMSVRQQYPLVVVGGKGWGHVDVHHFVRSFNLEGLVHVTGFVSDEQLSTLYAHARLVAMPSLYEGFGLPLIEAMSYGVPVLTSNISSLPEVAGDAGVLIDPFNVSSIAAGLVRVLTDDTLHEILSASALSRSKLFSWDKAAQGALAVFQEAVNERRTR